MEGYTFDRIKVQAANDGALYNLLNKNMSYAVSDLLNGVEVTSSGLNAYVDTGYIIVQGRFIEVTEKTLISLPANASGYLVFEIDLTQTNEFVGVPGNADYKGINNQLTLKDVETLTPGNINNGDKITTFPIASFTTTGTTASLKKIQSNYKLIGLDTGVVPVSFVGVFPNVSYPFYYSITDKEVSFGGRGRFPRTVGHVFFILPEGVRPRRQIMKEVDFIDSDPAKRALFEINTDGTCKVYYNSNDGVEVSIDNLKFTMA